MSSPPRWQKPLERAVRNPELARGVFCPDCQLVLTNDGTTNALLYHTDCLELLADHLAKQGAQDKSNEQ